MKDIYVRVNTLILFAIVFIFFNACEKDKNLQTSDDQFPSRLYPVNSIIISTKVYSRNGEVTDSLLIKGAFETTGMNILLRPKNSSLIGDSSSYIRFVSRNQFYLEPASSQPYSVTKTDSLFVFTNTDSNFNPIPATPSYYQLADMFFKYPELTRISSSVAIGKRKFSGYGDYNKLSLRGLDMCVLQRDSVTKAFQQRFFRTTYNEFDTASVKYLGKYDTIAVRRYDVNYSR